MLTIAHIRPLGYNVGNHAIAFAIRQLLFKSFGRLVSIVEYPASSKYDSINAGITKSTVHDINRYADGVIIGGGNLYENDELDVHPGALAALQPPLLLFSNSIGRIYGRKGRLIMRSDAMSESKLSNLVNASSLSYSRDSHTHQYLSSLGLKDNLGYCPTLNVNDFSDCIPSLPAMEKPGTLISVRTPKQMNIPFRHQAKVQDDIEIIIQHLRKLGHDRIRILCNDSRDLDFATCFKSCNVDSIYTDDVYQYFSLLKQARMVVSYRLHASLPALSFGRPTLNITYDERATCLFNDLNLSEYTINMIENSDNFRDVLIAKLSKLSDLDSVSVSSTSAWSNACKLHSEIFDNFNELVRNYVAS
tara:strand:- start:16383 stop:17465 length:1083 start_codon:yes stop_codon:yes gene_type:complete